MGASAGGGADSSVLLFPTVERISGIAGSEPTLIPHYPDGGEDCTEVETPGPAMNDPDDPDAPSSPGDPCDPDDPDSP
ncbi:hypothetical protein OBBRIDRAFT_837776 [Obba rivulosa]|uniref:Uncharacterized protein n=1 Tax=Obba rivulosa TaxID=1052685 RepID=A0A8E2AS38_9APHY|nr:hypothetical protein OBBRIDRAFT_837776 [Obba rivulosa]